MLDVRPRVPLANLSRIMRIAEGKLRELESFLSHYTERPESFALDARLFAAALTDRIRDIAFDGLIKKYIEQAEGTAFSPGRLFWRDDATVFNAGRRGITFAASLV